MRARRRRRPRPPKFVVAIYLFVVVFTLFDVGALFRHIDLKRLFDVACDGGLMAYWHAPVWRWPSPGDGRWIPFVVACAVAGGIAGLL